MIKLHTPVGRPQRQRGAATLIVVMVLFFVMSMVAAYTSRNLIFEQKTSTNQLRSTQAGDAAEAGLQWALGLLNSGRIDAQCRPSVDPALNTFRQRYLQINGDDGVIAPVLKSDGGTLTAGCVWTGTTWNCSCPVDGDPALSATSGQGQFPAFRVRFRAIPTRPTVTRIEVVACTSYIPTCVTFGGQGADNEGRSQTRAALTLRPGLFTTPVAALTARQVVNFDTGGGPFLTLSNTQATASGITLHAGVGSVSSGLTLETTPGSPTARSLRFDPTFTPPPGDTTAVERFFAATFAIGSQAYREQPAAVVLDCGGTCTSTELSPAVDNNPWRVIWVKGDLNITSGTAVGSPTDPVIIVVDGNLSFSAAATINGLVYVRAANWTTSGSSAVNGAVIAEGNVAGTSTATFSYNPDILTLLRNRYGSFVAIPATWQDF